MEKPDNKKIGLLLIFPLILGILVLFLSYRFQWLRFVVLFSGLIAVCAVVIVRTLPEARSRRFLLVVFAVSLVIRLVFTTMVHLNSVGNGGRGYFYKYVYNRGSDDEFYDMTGQAIAGAWKTGKLLDFPSMMKYRGGVHIGYNMFVGLIYLLCGHNLLFGKFINCLLGSMVCVYIFFIGKIVFDEAAARLAAVLCALDTYMIFFGCFLYKDIIIAFLMVFVIWHFLKYVKTGSKWSLIYVIPAILLEFFTRTYMGAALGMALFTYFLVFAAPKDRGRKVIYFVILFIISLPFFYVFYRIAKSQLGSRVIRVKGEGGQAEDTGMQDTRVFSPGRLAKNLSRIFFSPIPWRNLKDSWENIFYWVYPGKWIWYLFLPFFFVGAWYGLRYKFRESFVPAAVVFQYIVILIVIMQTAYRHQAPIMPLMLLTASAGFCKTKNPLLPYLIYIPCLVVFFAYDNDFLKEGALIIIALAFLFLVYLFFAFRKRIAESEKTLAVK